MWVLGFTNHECQKSLSKSRGEAEWFGQTFLARMICKTQYSHFRSHSNHIVENYYSGEKQNEKIYDVKVKSLLALYKVEVISLLALYKVEVISLFALYKVEVISLFALYKVEVKSLFALFIVGVMIQSGSNIIVCTL